MGEIVMTQGNFDYIVIGAGSAGCTIASRLSEDHRNRVLLIEAGKKDRDPFIHLPVGFAKMTEGPLTWGYSTEPVAHANNRVLVYPQGKVLGGGSSINAMVYTRGCLDDYDRWADVEGCTGWSGEDVLPYFIRSESNVRYSRPHHGDSGPLSVSDNSHISPMTRVFVKAAQQAGLPYNADFNGAQQAGCGFYQTTTRNGRRCSAAVGYLKPALDRTNLQLLTQCVVRRVLFEDRRAVGVEYEVDGRIEQARASGEIVITSGAIGSPKLLMLSGIGPVGELAHHGIPVLKDAAAVGGNLQDHMDVDIVAELRGPFSYDKYKKPHWKLWAGMEYLMFRRGPVSSNIVEGGAFWWSDRKEKTPDLQFHFLAGAGVEKGIGSVPGGNGCTLNSYHLRPRSRGSVKLASNDPSEAPKIDLNCFSDPYDLERGIDGVKLSLSILSQKAFEPFIRRIHMPGHDLQSHDEFADFVRSHARTAYHPVGTCRMGGSEASVVDPELRVRGVEGLRVCDSSVMPRIVSSNTNAPTIMLAEKASDLILGKANRQADLKLVS
ncbi:GMC family oxidoreductase N-terminal domain-containing protein [Brucella sp. NBRC 12950]|uniref:GMC family oxidoreductase n=1 Tax=Brucella sp. NBRC 12950 TaxID=2994518 RepID=UPI0024A4C130|nr:GMC family oxidoreductase N-terminal domain-containing protein [Brucella sp. NBRC 12950]GLU29837.1 alanine-phosphoribitol ligase [Brucella sp. NBRC 12950]